MDRANALADEDSREQDWERGSTTWHFADGSALEISCESVSVVSSTAAPPIETLGALWAYARDRGDNGVATNDRGNGSAGPSWIHESEFPEPEDPELVALGRQVDLSDPVTEVSESEDPGAWLLARMAMQDIESEPTRVFVGAERHPGEFRESNPYQIVYVV
jgi:hypothetical protein